MLFNSLDFAVFLPLVFALYWAIGGRNVRLQNAFLLLASYVFYGWWDWRFLGLIALSSAVDYVAGHRRWLYLSLVTNLGLLGVFKYFDFFADSFAGAFTLLGRPFDPWMLGIVLPVGISFYTFQTLSYTIDVCRGRITPTRDPVAFFAFVSFFPQLVAGPIERAEHLLPQFLKDRRFTYPAAVLGLRQILWGLFKKMVIADNCGAQVDYIWSHAAGLDGGTLALGAILFAFQIYGDFSGYSDIAIGTARLFGFDLRRNFAYPYFSRNVAEFWRRWHISLSTWFRDYVFIPLGGSRHRAVRNIWIVFLVSGFWHGANWTFLAWGAVHAALYSLLLIGKRNAPFASPARLTDLPRILLTFLLVTLAWVLFRSASVGEAGMIYGKIFCDFQLTELAVPRTKPLWLLSVLLPYFLLVEWWGRREDFALARLGERWPTLLRWGWYTLLVAALGLFQQTAETPFIYFQF